MKKFFKLFVISFITFGMCFTVNAGVCDEGSSDVRKIEIDEHYHETNWDAVVKKCKWIFQRWAYTACSNPTSESASNVCRGQHSADYKGITQTREVGQCHESSICHCVTGTATCNLTVKTTSTESCTKGSAGCVCQEKVRPQNQVQINDGGGGSSSGDSGETPAPKEEVCKKTVTTYSHPSVSLSGSYADSCYSSHDEIKEKLSSDMKDDCDGYKNSSYGSGTVTSVSYADESIDENFNVKYGIYKCEPIPFQVQNVREVTFKTLNADKTAYIPVYCINPEQDASELTHVYNVNAKACSDSFSNRECGFANILIESYYRGYNIAITGAAMRLWSYHTGYHGFGSTGIGNEDNTTCLSDDCMEDDFWLSFSADNVNVYRKTVEFLVKSFAYINSSDTLNNPAITDFNRVDTVAGGGISNLHLIACDKDKRLGNLCSNLLPDGSLERNDYLYAISLFVNTIQGNDLMQQHLDEINGVDSATLGSPLTSAVTVNNGSSTYLASAEDGITALINNPTGFRTTSTQRMIDGRVKTTITIQYTNVRENVECSTLPANSKNRENCEMTQQIVVKDINGNVLKSSSESHYDYCNKNYCQTSIEVESSCSQVGTVQVKSEFVPEGERDRCGAFNVKRYEGCSNPADHQVMYSIEPDENCDDASFPGVNNPPLSTKMGNVVCTGCTDDAVSSDKDCTSSSSVTNYVNDPSLNCILHKDSTNNKNKYDYSEAFGVNTDVCRVFCSDKVTYTLSGRKQVLPSFQLKYDLEADLNRSFSSNGKKLLSVIEMERNCVSEIYYDRAFEMSSSEISELLNRYGLSSVTVRNWKELYNAVKTVSEGQTYREEVLKGLIYDLYNCNFYAEGSDGEIVSGIKRPDDRVNALDTANQLLSDTKTYCNGTDKCINGYFEYEGGAEYISLNKRVGEGKNNPKLKVDMTVNTNDIDVNYCQIGDCFTGVRGGKYPEDMDSDNFSIETSSVEICKGENDCYSVVIPSNDYAIFSLDATSLIYNNTRYQTEYYSGKVQVYNAADNDKYNTLTKYTFPVSAYALDVCKDGDSDDSTLDKDDSCNVRHNYSIPAYTEHESSVDKPQLLFSRNDPNDTFVNMLNKTNSYSCSYDVRDCPDCDEPQPLYFFRNIDLADPVPTTRNGTNWDGTIEDNDFSEYVAGVIEEIKESSNQNLYVTNEYLEYSFVLDSNAIENIRENNKSNGYFKNDLEPLKGDDENDVKSYLNRKSDFLGSIRNDTSTLGIVSIKDDGVSDYTKNKEGLE